MNWKGLDVERMEERLNWTIKWKWSGIDRIQFNRVEGNNQKVDAKANNKLPVK